MTVNKDRVVLLVEALRSGEYPQCRSYLTKTVFPTEGPEEGVRGFCCLGVATEVAIKNGLEGLDRYGHGYRLTEPDEHGSLKEEEGHLPGPVQDWYGFGSANPQLKHDTGEVSPRLYGATWLNDEVNLSLSQIADAFELTYLSEPSDEVPGV